MISRVILINAALIPLHSNGQIINRILDMFLRNTIPISDFLELRIGYRILSSSNFLFNSDNAVVRGKRK